MFGLILWLIGGSKAEQWLRFDTRIFDFILLPAIIFEGGYSLKKKGLFNNLATVLMYSVIGTVISTVFIGYMLYVFARYAHVNSVGTYDWKRRVQFSLTFLLFSRYIKSCGGIGFRCDHQCNRSSGNNCVTE